jgi:hypothetical protein
MVSINNPNKPNRWYSKKWNKAQISVNGSDFKDYDGAFSVSETTTVKAKIVTYSPSIKDRFKALMS